MGKLSSITRYCGISAFTKAIEDDLSTPKALSELQVAIKNPEIPATEKLALIDTNASDIALIQSTNDRLLKENVRFSC